MHRLGDGPSMNLERRNELLLQIATGRAQEARVNSFITTLPAWADRPFKDDQDKFNQYLKAYQTASPLVLGVESRLALEPGPVWKDLTPAENAALLSWTESLGKLNGYVDYHFPTDAQRRAMEYLLWAIALGSLVVPLLISEDGSDLEFPLDIKPIPLPPSMKPSPSRVMTAQRPASTYSYASRPAIPSPSPTGFVQRPVFAPTSFAPTAFAPTSFSKIPSAGPIPVKAEVLRPAASGMPWKSSGPLSAPGYRSFAKPLGPVLPATVATVQATATAAPASPHGARVYPRFRSQ
jgi:hypothetical protein